MYVDWEYYKIFYYVAKYQNFTKAARVLGNNQPNITHSMNRLESQLNCVLFTRSNRGVTLTPEGEMLYSRIASAAVQIQDAEEELSASATLEHGSISISATETALNIYLAEKLRTFHTEYPGIRLRISNHSTPQAVQAVKNGEVDFAIISTPAEVEQGLKMVELKPFCEVLVGGKTFTALASQRLTLKELSCYPLISLSDESMTRSFYRQFFLDHDAVFHEDSAGRDVAGKAHLVGDDQHGHALLCQLPHDGQHLAGQFRVEGAGGLIEIDDLGAGGKSAGDGHALLLTARQLMRVGIRLVGKSDAAEQLHRLGLRRRLVHFLQLDRRKHDVLQHGEVGEQVEALEHHADVLAHLVDIGLFVGDHGVVYDDLAAGRLLELVETAEQRGLARTGRSDDADNLALGDGEVDAVENLELVKVLDKISDLNLFCHSSSSFQCGGAAPSGAR